ncbi:hypothetical protein SSTU70S_01048 [Stutzerimonas stutzeri]
MLQTFLCDIENQVALTTAILAEPLQVVFNAGDRIG